ncbi:hypothetical protein CPHO_07195 [Corynebacterium phocae]|uniref:Single-stranded DNA-binding protein n=1 Tax=Corynebacterium phocae TaxID=161895 RepID=A0A1L7D3X3_9CORY|nr:single-stranded DNA-binding protein [Corynebacterium phocae]APT92711.1 hypothetical protein CPHO_07195 [Corynebacterium phocae]
MAIDYEFRSGRLTRDPELRFLPNSDTKVVNFCIAQSAKKYDENARQWVTTREQFVDVAVWDDSRNNNMVPWTDWCMSNLAKGDLIAVHGFFQTRRWQTQSGENRSKLEFTAQGVWLSLRSLEQRDTPPGGGSGGPWPDNNDNNNQQQQQQGGSRGGFGAANDEPPF